jgi:CrcB protein
LKKYLIVGAGGALGALTRYWIGNLFKIGQGEYPWGTFLINLSGCFGLGLFLTLITERYRVRDEWRLLCATGFVGAYTTFSTFTSETLSLFRQGYVLMGLAYSVFSLVGGLSLVTLGWVLARLVAFGRIRQNPDQATVQARREEASRQQAALTGQPTTGPLPTEERSELEPD